MRKILVTSALPYANGSIHLGHLVEYLQTDIWVRNQKMSGNTCYYICADDAHGTPIMLKAKELDVKPEELIQKTYQEHVKDFEDFGIEFDNYHTTHSEENREYSEFIYNSLKDNGDIKSQEIEQFYDESAKMFLPDRYIKGICPKCGAEDQYGDACEECGATYSPTELKKPISIISNTKPSTKKTEHFFFKLSNYTDYLKKWMKKDSVQSEIQNKLEEWLKDGLADWDITRDKPYFGFNIPGYNDKYFYVWLDAPVGYIASFKNMCDTKNINFDEFWNHESECELYHFIGKDIAYFHALFWPAMLEASNFRSPNSIYCHGFLTVDGEKMSKSRGTFFNARTYLNHLNPEYLRYYFASRLTNTIEDIDLNLSDFQARVNSDLVGKIINIGSRCARFINKDFGNELASELNNNKLHDNIIENKNEIIKNYEDRKYSANIRLITSLADEVNKYLDEEKPWVQIKDNNNRGHVQKVCTDGLNMFKVLAGYLKPIIPDCVDKIEKILQCESLSWENIDNRLISKKIDKFEPIINRIDSESIESMRAESGGKK
jgi:methionyl-tRNA synthetase